MDEPSRPRAPSKRVRVLGLVALALGTAWLGRALVVRVALAAATGLAAQLGGVGIAPERDPEAMPEVESALDEESREGLDAEQPPDVASGEAPPQVSQSAWGPRRTVEAYATAEQVLHWANAGVVPRGSRVAARGPCPAGIKLRGAGVYGLGIEDGDLLVSVEGVPVGDRSQVVSTVLAGRGRMKRTIEAVVMRPRTGCRTSVHVVLEQPYPTEEQLRRSLPPAGEDAGAGAVGALTPPPPSLERAVSKAPQ